MAKQKCRINPMVRPIVRLCCFIVIFLFIVPDKTVLADIAKEYKVKAAFTLNFARYAKWPVEVFTDPSSPCILCVVGDSRIEPAFRTVAGKKIGIRKLMVRFAKRPQDVEFCHMIFISRDVKASDVSQILEAVKGKPVLTISETKAFIRQGGMISFFTKSGRLYFEINMDIVRQQQVKLSSRLLKLAILAGEK